MRCDCIGMPESTYCYAATFAFCYGAKTASSGQQTVWQPQPRHHGCCCAPSCAERMTASAALIALSSALLLGQHGTLCKK